MMPRPANPLIEFDCKLGGDVLLSSVYYASGDADSNGEKQKAGREALTTFIAYLAEHGFIRPLTGDEFEVKRN